MDSGGDCTGVRVQQFFGVHVLDTSSSALSNTISTNQMG